MVEAVPVVLSWVFQPGVSLASVEVLRARSAFALLTFTQAIISEESFPAEHALIVVSSPAIHVVAAHDLGFTRDAGAVEYVSA